MRHFSLQQNRLETKRLSIARLKHRKARGVEGLNKKLETKRLSIARLKHKPGAGGACHEYA